MLFVIYLFVLLDLNYIVIFNEIDLIMIDYFIIFFFMIEVNEHNDQYLHVLLLKIINLYLIYVLNENMIFISILFLINLLSFFQIFILQHLISKYK
jgi:hypothetical protein